jgi:hypothetical protein
VAAGGRVSICCWLHAACRSMAAQSSWLLMGRRPRPPAPVWATCSQGGAVYWRHGARFQAVMCTRRPYAGICGEDGHDQPPRDKGNLHVGATVTCAVDCHVTGNHHSPQCCCMGPVACDAVQNEAFCISLSALHDNSSSKIIRWSGSKFPTGDAWSYHQLNEY